MAIILAQLNLNASSGIPEDDIVNTFALSGPVPVQGNTLPLTQAFERLFNGEAATPGADTLAAYISSHISRSVNACVVSYYDITNNLDGSPHGSPVAVDAFTLDANGGHADMPAEVAMCVTLRGSGWDLYPVEAPDGSDDNFVVDRPRQRRTGRVYIGPLTTFAGGARPSAGFMEGCLDSFQLFDSYLDAAGYTLGIWSRTNEAFVNCSVVQVDDAFDTQRRRGPDPTTRLSRTIGA